MGNYATPLDEFINAFALPLLNQGAAARLSEEYRPEQIAGYSIERKLSLSGALLAVGRIGDYRHLVEHTDYNVLSFNDRVTFADTLFRSLQTYLCEGNVSETCVEALIHITRALLPSVMFPGQDGITHSDSLTYFNEPVQLSYASSINPNVNGIVFFRDNVMGPGSRKHEFGLRIQKSLASQGWKVSLQSSEQLLGFSTTAIYDFVLIDIALLNIAGMPREQVVDMLIKIRRNSLKIIVVEPDPWCPEHNKLFVDILDYVDFIWGFSTDWQLLREKKFSDKAILFPNVGGFDDLTALAGSLPDWNRCTFSFIGSIGIPNLHRMYWCLESLHRKLPIRYTITIPGRDDGMGREASLLNYATLLSASHVGINYVKRFDGTRILTGRTIELISLKRLLLQETCPAMKSYFVEGEHFLEFSDMNGLCNAIDFIRTHPKTAQFIAREGHEYYLQHYSCKKLVEHFQTCLDI